jgi:hypothetical protein
MPYLSFLSSAPRPAFLGFLLALAAALAGPAAPPARADIAVLPLEAARILPVPDENTGHTTPAVALRPDGGYVAVWGDIETGKIIGRWFGPADALGESESGVFELTAEDATSAGPVVTARSTQGSYLAVWETPPPGPSQLVARAFDGEGQPLWPSQVVAVGEMSPFGFDLAPRPGGGFVLVWGQEDGTGWEVRHRFLDPVGIPFGSIQVAALPADARGPRIQVAADATGAFAVTWSWWRTTDAGGALEARGFSTNGQPLGPAFELVPEGETRFEIQHDLAALETGEYLVAWAAESSVEQPARSIQGLRFAGDGDPIGLAQRLDTGDDPDRFVVHPALAATLGGQAVVAWVEGTVEFLPDTPRGRLLDGDGEPRSDAFDLMPGPVTGGGDYVNGLDLDRSADGLLVFGWGIGFLPAVLPTGAEAFLTSRARRFQETQEDCDPILTLTFETDPPAPDEDDAVELRFGGLADCAQLVLADWNLVGDTFHVEAEAETQACGTFPPFPLSLLVPVGPLAAGAYDVELDIALPGGGSCQRSFGFSVDPAEPPPPPPPPPPPDAAPLTTDAIPGFRFWVEITAQGGDAILGSKVGPCIPETLCVSGRLPGRHEVFARIVGPKPNGHLWPTLVKFTTSQVEVWIEQVSTGEVEYYLLEGASRGFDELPGLFDREGFEP